MKKNKTDVLFITILGLISMLTPLAIDMYLSSFGAMAKDFSVSEEKIQITLALFTFGFAVGQLFWGPLSDSIGRKVVILTGILTAAIIAFALTQVGSLKYFYILRLLQGFFGAAPAAVVGALLKDIFQKDEFVRMISMVMIVTMVSPLIAPILGGHLADWFNWRIIFYLLSALGILSSILVFIRIPETLPKERRIPLNFSNTLRSYNKLLINRKVLGYVLTNAFSFSGMFCFLTSGSVVYTKIYGVEPKNFGYFFILNTVIMMVSTFLSGKYVSKIGSEKILRIGLIIQSISGIWLAICGIFQLGLWEMAIAIGFYVGMIAIVSSNSNAAILELFPRIAGTANSLAGMLRFSVGAIVGGILSSFTVTSERPMVFAIAINIIIAFIFYLTCVKKSKSK